MAMISNRSLAKNPMNPLSTGNEDMSLRSTFTTMGGVFRENLDKLITMARAS
jgi:hypothetical protein